jgi:hypothetical protein
MAVDISAISYFGPILAFLIVFVILYAVLARSKLFGSEASPWILLFVSFLVATVFVSAAGVRDYVLTITPWFATLVVSLFFIIFLLKFMGKNEKFEKGVGIGAVIVLVIVFLVSGFVVFSDIIGGYLPGGGKAEEIYGSRIFGAFLLLVLSGIVSLVIARKGKKDDD